MKDIDENGVDRMERFRGYSQRFTQFSVADEVYRETLEYMKHLRKERDEARRELCKIHALGFKRGYIGTHGYPCSSGPSAMCVAAERGWDCFKEGNQSC